MPGRVLMAFPTCSFLLLPDAAELIPLSHASTFLTSRSLFKSHSSLLATDRPRMKRFLNLTFHLFLKAGNSAKTQIVSYFSLHGRFRSPVTPFFLSFLTNSRNKSDPSFAKATFLGFFYTRLPTSSVTPQHLSASPVS